jgi:hypothetical protein
MYTLGAGAVCAKAMPGRVKKLAEIKADRTQRVARFRFVIDMPLCCAGHVPGPALFNVTPGRKHSAIRHTINRKGRAIIDRLLILLYPIIKQHG